MKPLLYVGCPTSERPETESVLASASFSVVWADSAAAAIGELQKQDMPVLLDLSRGAAALQIARDLRAQRSNVLLFAVVDNRRPDLTTEAVLTGVADVFARLQRPGAWQTPSLRSCSTTHAAIRDRQIQEARSFTVTPLPCVTSSR